MCEQFLNDLGICGRRSDELKACDWTGTVTSYQLHLMLMFDASSFLQV